MGTTTSAATTTSTGSSRPRARRTAAVTRREAAPPLVRVRAWNPDRRWLHPLVTAVWLHLLSWVSLLGVSPWWMLLGGLAGTLVLVMAGRRHAPAARFGDVHPRQITWLAAAVGLTATVWLVWMVANGPLNGPGLGALVIGTVVFGLVYAAWQSSAPKRATATTRAERVRQEVTLRSEWTEILAAAGIRHMQVVDRRPHQAGYTLVLEHRRPSGPDAAPSSTVTLSQLSAAAPAIAAEAARALADTGAVISAQGIRAEETEYAHRFRLHVTTIDVLAAAMPYQARTTPASIVQPLRLGLYETGEPLDLIAAGIHGKIVGATQSGKSVLLNNKIARELECDDVVLWVAASSKLVPLVYPWLRPWILGHTRRPVLDWVAGEDQREILIMLAAMYHASKIRADLLTTEGRLIPSPQLPALVGVLDEASTALCHKMTIQTFDGQEMNASQLAMEITQIGAAVNVTLWLATQYGLFPAAGPYGSEIHRNLGVRIALKTQTASDGRDTLVGMPGNVDTTRLRHKSMLVQPNIEEPRVLPAKACHLEGAELIGSLVEQYTAWRPDLDEYTAGALAGYAGRWTRQRCATLAGVVAREGHDWPVIDHGGTSTTGGDHARGDLDDQNVIDALFDELVETRLTTPADDAPQTTAPADPVTAGDLQRGLDDLERGMQAANDRMGAVYRIGDPLAQIARELGDPEAPKDFVSTRQLAVVLGRVQRGASDEEVNKAAATLGREINRQVPALKTVQRTVEGQQVRGYPVKRLWQAIHHLAYGKPMSEDTSDSE